MRLALDGDVWRSPVRPRYELESRVIHREAGGVCKRSEIDARGVRDVLVALLSVRSSAVCITVQTGSVLSNYIQRVVYRMDNALSADHGIRVLWEPEGARP